MKVYNSYDDTLLVGDYDIHNSILPTLTDVSGNANNATVTGATLSNDGGTAREWTLKKLVDDTYF